MKHPVIPETGHLWAVGVSASGLAHRTMKRTSVLESHSEHVLYRLTGKSGYGREWVNN